MSGKQLGNVLSILRGTNGNGLKENENEIRMRNSHGLIELYGAYLLKNTATIHSCILDKFKKPIISANLLPDMHWRIV